MKNVANKFGRRDFLKSLGLAAPLILAAPGAAVAAETNAVSAGTPSPRAKELVADLVVIGGGLGGCAAALAAARNGLAVILTEETDWIGGQITQQVVPPDENKWIETVGASRSYQTFRTGIRDYYRRNYPLTEAARAQK